MQNVQMVLEAYLGEDKPTIKDVAERLGTHEHNVLRILRLNLAPDVYKQEKRLRYSRSKVGANNPMLGKYGRLHHRYKGEVFTKDGYLQVKHRGSYVLVHRLVMAEMLGVAAIPDHLDVHHIDGVKTNNDPDNLAIVTRGGHRQLHASTSLLSRSPIWVQHMSTTSRSKRITPT